MKRVVALVSLVGIIAMLSADGSAQAGAGSIRIRVGPETGTRLTNTSVFYDRPNQRIDVLAWTGNAPPFGALGDWAFVLNGQRYPAAMVQTINGQKFGFSAFLQVPPRGTVGQLSFLVELFHRPTKQVLGREIATVWDLRDSPLQPTFGDDALDAEIGVQLTARGLDTLEGPHAATLPWPNASALDDVFNALPPIEAPGVNMIHVHGGANRTCVPLNELPAAFKDTADYQAALDEAMAYFLMYAGADGADALGGPEALGATIGAAVGGPGGLVVGVLVGELINLGVDEFKRRSCVRDLPTDGRFEVCVGRISGPLTGVDVNVSTVDLSLNANRVKAEVTLSGPHATINGRLGELVLRWADHYENGAFAQCSLYPSKDLTEGEIAFYPGVDEWASCPALSVGANIASTFDTTDPARSAGVAPVFAFGAGLETLEVNQVNDAGFELGATKTMSTPGACGHPNLRADTEQFLDQYYPELEGALNDAWNYNRPSTQHADGLQALLSPFQIGLTQTPDLELNSPIHRVDASWQMGPTAPPHGLIATWDTNPFELFTNRRPTNWVYPLMSWVADPVNFSPGVDQFFGTSDETPGNPREPFDFAVQLTPGTLNQYLRERYLAPQYGLNGRFRPTYSDVGERPPRGVLRSTPIPLTGRSLGRVVHNAFRAYGNTPFRIRLRPDFMPFTFIPDLLNAPPNPGDYPVVYQMSRLWIEFLSEDPADPDPIKLRVLAGFADTDLSLNLSATQGKLLVNFGSAGFGFTVMEHQFSNCALTPRVFPLKKNGCEEALTAGVAALIQPLMQRRLLSMLDDFVLPASFNVQGKVDPLDAETTLKWIDGGTITFFTNLLPRQ